MAHGSARASHNTGPLGVASQYRITNWGKTRDWAYWWFPLPHRNLSLFQPGINSKCLPCGGFWVGYQGHEDDPFLTQDRIWGEGLVDNHQTSLCQTANEKTNWKTSATVGPREVVR